MVTGWRTRGGSPTGRAAVLAGLAVLPLLATEAWSGFHLGLTDPALSVISPLEQPLSVRSLGGGWTMALAVAWFALAYRRRDYSIWEVGLVLVGGAIALARLGNAWLDAVAMFAPLTRQLARARPKPRLELGLAVLSLGVASVIIVVGRPPALPEAARAAAAASASSSSSGAVFTDWRWGTGLRRQFGDARPVLPGPATTGASASEDFWMDYLRVIQGHERWGALLDQWNVQLVVLDAADQDRQVAALIRASAEWQVVYDRDGALVARRTSPSSPAVLR